jgi:hypothetical protein
VAIEVESKDLTEKGINQISLKMQKLCKKSNYVMWITRPIKKIKNG